MKAKILFILISLIGILVFCSTIVAQTGSSNMPKQLNIKTNKVTSYNTEGCTFKIYPKASYSLKARVKSKKYYNRSSGWESMIAPYDLCLAWGSLANEFGNKIVYSQSKRWCNFKYKAGTPYDLDHVYLHHANNHIIAATRNVQEAIASIDKEQLVYLEGFLVDVRGKCSDGKTYWWNSSLSRKDRGDGACEVFLVTKAVINGKMYQ